MGRVNLLMQKFLNYIIVRISHYTISFNFKTGLYLEMCGSLIFIVFNNLRLRMILVL